MASEEDLSANERKAARAALRAIDPEWPGDAALDSVSPRAAEQMQSTLAALRGWQASLAALPAVAVPDRPLRVLPWRRWGISFAAAAVLLLGVGLWWGQQPLVHVARVEPPPAGVAAVPAPVAADLDAGPPPPAEIGAPQTGTSETGSLEMGIRLADSAQWLADAPVPEVIGKGGAGVGSEGGGVGPPGGKKPPRGTGGGSIDGGFGGGGKASAKDAGEEFLAGAKLDFSMRVPLSLAGGWTFLRGKALDATRVQLTYTAGDRVLSVLVWKDAGETSDPHERVLENGRRLWVIRRAPVGVAFEGEILRKDASQAAPLFAPANP